MELERREGESALQYHRRLVYGKLVDHTLADVDYAELSEYAYGQAYESNSARKMLYGSRRTLELLDEERRSGVKDADMAAELDEKILTIQKEKQQFYDQRREYQNMIRRDGREEHLRAMIAEAADRLGEEIGLMYPVGYEAAGDGRAYRGNEAVLVFSDWHYGMKTANLFNEFNTEICRERVRRTVERAIERIELHKCGTAHIVVLGDLYHGACHVSARVASEEAACEQLMHVSEILAQAVYEISKHVSCTYVHMTYGNHARTVQDKKDSIHRDNMERVVRWWLEERFRHDDEIRVMPESPGEFLFLDVCGHSFCASHGDLDSVQSSPRLLSVLCQKTVGVDLEYILLGDKHHRESFNELGVTAMLCGSLCGTDDYANDRRLYSDPSQMLLIVNRECGVDAEYRIKC